MRIPTTPSGEFRKSYAKLTLPTFVTVNGRIIGTWVPLEYNQEAAAKSLTHAGKELEPTAIIYNDGEGGQVRRRIPQAERDAILRRINKGG